MKSKEVADLWSGKALELFHDRGHLVPTVGLLGDKTIIIVLSDLAIQDFQTSLLRVVALVSSALDRNPDFVVTVVEGWAKTFPVEEGFNEEEWPHGRVQKEQEAGDTGIHTVLGITVFDGSFQDRSHGVIIDADDDFTRSDHPGRQEGGVADHVYAALTAANKGRSQRPPNEYAMETVMEILAPLVEYVTVV